MSQPSPAPSDALLHLRQSIATASPPYLSTSTAADSRTDELALATHLLFDTPALTPYPLSTLTRFISAEKAVDLRSIWFAWQHKDDPIPDYIASAQDLNDALAASEANAEARVQNLPFVERLDLITWLEGSSDDSEYIKPLEGAAAATQAAAGAPGAPGTTQSTVGGAGTRVARSRNPVLQAIYNNERRMGDRNSILRGIKPTDFSHVRKLAESYLRTGKQSSKPGATNAATAAALASTTMLPNGKPNKPGRRPDPIILLSPSASSTLRMSNIKSFLSDGTYILPDSTSASASTSILHISRLLPSIDATRPQRFILVDSPDQFKPDYWSRVVAVFTTGQAWQFKSYKWTTPQELFSHVLGIYVGWRGENVPEPVKGWGRGVMSVGVEQWRGEGVQRWRDREVVEGLWRQIEEQMRSQGWGTGGLGGR